nr:hypothetical protein Itr_chr07CG19250 [Ipomoea trifida]
MSAVSGNGLSTVTAHVVGLTVHVGCQREVDSPHMGCQPDNRAVSLRLPYFEEG